MKHLKFIAIAFTMLLFTGCSSDDSSDNINPNQECKISKITYATSYGDKVYNAIYVGKNLTELSSDSDKVVFIYNSQNQLIKREKFENGNSQAITKQEFTPNSNGQIIEAKYWDTYNGNLIYVGKDTYHYNGNKLAEIWDYEDDNVTIQGKHIYEWTGNNPTKLSFFDENNVFECETTIAYDLNKENKFNNTFQYFMFQNVIDEDYNLYLFLGKNAITSTTNSCSTNSDTYNHTLLSNGLTDNIKRNGSLIYKFEYICN